MVLHLHIDNLALTGLKISRNQRPQLQSALEAELARLFGANGVPNDLLKGGRVSKLRADVIAEPASNAIELGQAIAQAIYTDLNIRETHYATSAGAANSISGQNTKEQAAIKSATS